MVLLRRLRTLSRYVTTFVLGFSNATFTDRHPRALSFSPFESEISRFESQLAVTTFDISQGSPWTRERVLRDRLLDGVKRCKPQADDLVIVSDCDEILKPSTLREMMVHPPAGLVHVRAAFFYSSHHFRVDEGEWPRPDVIRYGAIADTVTNYRSTNLTAPPAIAAVHCSYCFGSISEIIRKLQTFSHTEYSSGRWVDPGYTYARAACGYSLFTKELVVVDYDPHEMDIPASADYLSWRMPFTDLARFPLNPERIRMFAPCQNSRMDIVNGTFQPWAE
jgi:beta-1,4-mannosyl-glycoprotein beta-1,4-N-acetylglucosaminyltransferase